MGSTRQGIEGLAGARRLGLSGSGGAAKSSSGPESDPSVVCDIPHAMAFDLAEIVGRSREMAGVGDLVVGTP